MEYSVKKAVETFKGDSFAMEACKIEILDVADGYAKCCFMADESHKNARGAVMGGALFSLADFTFAIAANFNKDHETVTNVSSISFLRPALEGRITAESKQLREGKRTCTYQINITDEKGELLAVVTINGMHVAPKMHKTEEEK